MRLSVERLRWGLLAGALVLIAVLIGLVSYGRYRALKAYRRILARTGATITHDTNGFTYSQALKGRTIYMLHAAKAVPEGEGRYSLHDAVLVLYGPTGAAMDRIYGSEFAYDQKAGVAKALGEVQMDLEPPAGLSSAARGKGEAASVPAPTPRESQTPPVIHVRTSGLVYVRKLGVAATDQEVEIDYQGFRGYARGAEFDSGQSMVRLLADVRAEGTLRGEPMTLTAARADLDRNENVMRLTQPKLRSGSRDASAVAAVVHLRKDGSVEQLDADGAVELREGTRRITGGKLESTMNAESLVQHARLSGGVAIEDTSAARPMKGRARTVTVACERAGSPSSVVAEGAVTMSTQLQGPGGVVLHRQMAAERVMLTLERREGGGATQVSMVEAKGSATASGDSMERAAAGKRGAVRAPGVRTTAVAADDLRLMLAPDAAGKDQPQQLTGTGHTRLEERAADGAIESSMGDALQARFAGAGRGAGAKEAAKTTGVRIVAAVQTGHVRLRSEPAAGPASSMSEAEAKGAAVVSTGSAERASFDGALQQVTLDGRPQLQRGDTNISAQTITLAEESGDATAQGNVSASFVNAKAAAGSAVTHATAASALFHHAAQTVEFLGTDAQPARLWQGASQLDAASVVLDRVHDTLTARPAAAGGWVHAVFASSGTAAAGAVGTRRLGPSASNGPHVVRVASARLDYSGASEEAVFSGGVHTEGATGEVRAQRGVVFLTSGVAKNGAAGKAVVDKDRGQADPLGGSVDRIVLSGDVHLEQPGRQGTGEQLLYTAASGEFVLTGAPGRPPHVVDERQGSITGATLVFASPDSTIIVMGEPGTHGQVRGRVHTETPVRR